MLPRSPHRFFCKYCLQKMYFDKSTCQLLELFSVDENSCLVPEQFGTGILLCSFEYLLWIVLFLTIYDAFTTFCSVCWLAAVTSRRKSLGAAGHIYVLKWFFSVMTHACQHFLLPFLISPLLFGFTADFAFSCGPLMSTGSTFCSWYFLSPQMCFL